MALYQKVEIMNDHFKNVSAQTTQSTANPIDTLFVDNLLWDALPKELIDSQSDQKSFYIGLSQFIKTQMMMIRGNPLEEVLAEGESHLPFLRVNLPDFVPTLHISRQFIMNMMGRTKDLYSFSDTQVDEEELLAYLQDKKLNLPLSWYYLLKAQALYLLENYSEALQTIIKSNNLIQSDPSQIQTVEHDFYYSLILAAVYPTANQSTQEYYWKQLLSYQDKLQEYATDCPPHFLHKYLLVRAEIARLLQNDHQAMDLYDEAILLARENEFIQNEALANELFAKFWLSKGKEKYAKLHFSDAYLGYDKWGAMSKVKQLEESYLLWLKHRLEEDASIHYTSSSSMDKSTGWRNVFDFKSALKASQVLSSEMALGWLLEQLMYVMLENAGAERAVLILEEKGQFFIQAERFIEDSDTTVLHSLPIDDPNASALPLSLINHVVRTHQPVCLNHGGEKGLFTTDPYMSTQRPKSILCLPLLNQGRLNGILYFENNQVPNIFSPERIELLQLLCVQASISIDNAHLVEHLDFALQERKIALRQREHALQELKSALQRQVELTQAYSRFVPSQLLRHLGKDSIVDVKLGDHVQKEMTILFSDIRDFTSISENMTPSENFRFVNGYLSRMEPVINDHHGFIDKYIGDGIMALFPSSADEAVQAAIAMCQRLDLYNVTRQRPSRRPIKIGISVHTGLLMLGTIGGDNRMDGTVISDAVNLGAKLEKLTKQYGVELLISEQTYLCLKNSAQYAIREIDCVAVTGKSKPVTILEVFDCNEPKQIALKKHTLSHFKRGLYLYRQHKFVLACKEFNFILKVNPQDSVAQLYIKRCEQMQ